MGHAPLRRADDFAWPRRTVAPLGADPKHNQPTIINTNLRLIPQFLL
jgi:hypothetical protein